MDPLSIIKTCYELYESIHEKMKTVVKNRHQFEQLNSRVGDVKLPLQNLQALHAKGQLPCSEHVLRNFLKLLTKIDAFVIEKRFQVQANASSAVMNWLSEAYYASDDQARFVEFDKQITSHLQSLNLHITVTLCDYARAAHQDTAKASAQGHALQLRMIEPKALSYDSKTFKDKIGEGTFSTVMIGTYNKEYVAVKQVRNMANMTAADIGTIMKEAQVMQFAQHPHILSLKGVYPTKGLLVMELALCSLADYLYQGDSIAKERARPLVAAAAVPSLQWRVDVIRDVADAVQYLHGYNILHRDIKSSNVLLFRDASSGRTVAKVGDFGLALAADLVTRTAGPVATTTSAAQQLRAVGTYSYMAPELFDRQPGERVSYSEASDVYSLGTLANEVLTGRPPWEAGTREADIVNWVMISRLRPKPWTEDAAQVVVPTQASLERARLLCRLIGGSDELACCWSQQPSQRCTAENVFQTAAGSVSTPAPTPNPDAAGGAPSPPKTSGAYTAVALDEVAVVCPSPGAPSTGTSVHSGTFTPVGVSGSTTPRPSSGKSGLFSWISSRGSTVEMTAVGAVDDAQSMEDLALDLMRACPSICSQNAQVYARRLFGANIYNVRRLLDQVKDKTAAGKGVYEKWSAALGIDRYDAQDIAECDATPVPSRAQLTLQQLDSAHGEDRLVEWLARHVPDVAVAAKRQQAAAAFCKVNITCADRLVRRVDESSVEWLIKLGLDKMDAESTVEATAAARAAPASQGGDAVGAMTMDRSTSQQQDIVSALAVELCCMLPDVSYGVAVRYSDALCARNICTVHRLVVQFKLRGRHLLKQAWHEFDLQDVEDLAALPQLPQCRPLAEVQAQQGEEVLSLWLLDHVPNITLPRLRSTYSRALVAHNVCTIQRLDLRCCDEKWLTGVGIAQLDAKDIVAALQNTPFHKRRARLLQEESERAARLQEVQAAQAKAEKERLAQEAAVAKVEERERAVRLQEDQKNRAAQAKAEKKRLAQEAAVAKVEERERAVRLLEDQKNRAAEAKAEKERLAQEAAVAKVEERKRAVRLLEDQKNRAAQAKAEKERLAQEAAVARAEILRIDAEKWYPARCWNGHGSVREKRRAKEYDAWKPFCEHVLSPRALDTMANYVVPRREKFCCGCQNPCELMQFACQVTLFGPCLAFALGRSCAIKALYPRCPLAFQPGYCCGCYCMCCFSEEGW
jgi:serine/threonine protein kinase